MQLTRIFVRVKMIPRKGVIEMKKFIGYGVIYLIGLGCVVGMMLRVDSLDNKVANNDTTNKTNYVLNK